MAQGFPIPDKFSERHMETLQRKIEKCERLIAETLDYMQNPAHLKFSLQKNNNKKETGDFFQEFSRLISIFALENYLHNVVTPGIPNLPTDLDRVHFWTCICTNKLLEVKKYLTNREYVNDPHFLDNLWCLLRETNNSMRKLFSYAPT